MNQNKEVGERVMDTYHQRVIDKIEPVQEDTGLSFGVRGRK